jgi:hypothetical protein
VYGDVCGFLSKPTRPSRSTEPNTMPQRSVFCIALSRGRAGRIVLDLKEAMFSNTEISALFLDQSAIASHAAGQEIRLAEDESPIQSAAVICGVMAWIAAVACRVVPGIDPIIAAGPIASTLSDAEGGSVANGLIDLGVPHAEARRYEGRIKDGNILVSVHTESSDKSDQAREIFSAAGAEDICMMTENSSATGATFA